ncbi:nitroreductase family protein [Limnohabitans sp.]|uniref:nitroreductase family protein n=1 Tax=Limnohabitans sp. TaxID=1907725 RepID=UPI00311FFC1D
MSYSDIDAAIWAQTLIQSRRTTLPKRLIGPGPTAAQKISILEAAAAAPDHDQVMPWRFVEIPANARPALGDAFASALLERDTYAGAHACTQAKEKALRAPWLLLSIVRADDHYTDIPMNERILSAGAAIQNMLLMATAQGLGSSLTSGKALQSSALRHIFKLDPTEIALCFVNIGHIHDMSIPRCRPSISQYFSILDQAQA